MYDLTPKVTQFLDPKLAAQIDFFNKNGHKQKASETQVALVHVDASSPSLEAAHKMYECNQIKECLEMLQRLNVAPGTDDFETVAWAKLACRLLTVNGEEPAKAEGTAAAEGETEGETSAATGETADAAEVEAPAAPKEPENARDEQTHDPVLQEVLQVRECIDQRRSLPGEQLLNKRTWLLNWSLFAYFSGTRLQYLPDRLFGSMAMSVIQSTCPWILRYLAIAIVCLHSPTARYNRRIKDLVRVLQQESYEYKDTITDLVLSLYVDGDLDSVAFKLADAEETLKSDFFAVDLASEFVNKFRVLAADVYFKVHLSVSREKLATVLGFDEKHAPEFEKWFAAYLDHKVEAKLDVSYDEKTGIAKVAYTKHSVPAHIAEKVKHLDQKAKQIRQEV